MGSQTAYPFEQWRYHHLDGVGNNIIIEFVDRTWSADYRMTTDPSDKKAGATVEILGDRAAISIPLAGYGDHQLKLLGRLATSANRAVNVFEVGIQGPVPLYRKSVEVRPGSYRWTVTVKNVTTGGVAKDTIDFEVK